MHPPRKNRGQTTFSHLKSQQLPLLHVAACNTVWSTRLTDLLANTAESVMQAGLGAAVSQQGDVYAISPFSVTKVPPDKGTKNYDKFNCDFDFLPGAAGGVYPANRHLIPSIFLPFSNLIEWQVIISPLEASSDKQSRTLTSEIPTASAISISSRSPCVLRYCRISFIGLLPHPLTGLLMYRYCRHWTIFQLFMKERFFAG